MGQFFYLCLFEFLCLLEVGDGSFDLNLPLFVDHVRLVTLSLLQLLTQGFLAVLQRQVNRNGRQVVEEDVGLLVRDCVVQLRVNDSPERSFLADSGPVFAVQERYVQDLLGLVAPVVAHLLVLEVGVLQVAVFFEL